VKGKKSSNQNIKTYLKNKEKSAVWLSNLGGKREKAGEDNACSIGGFFRRSHLFTTRKEKAGEN